MAQLKRLPNSTLSAEQSEWLEQEQERTKQTVTAIIRSMIDREVKKSKRGRK